LKAVLLQSANNARYSNNGSNNNITVANVYVVIMALSPEA